MHDQIGVPFSSSAYRIATPDSKCIAFLSCDSPKDFKEFADAVETIKDNGVVVAVASIDDVEAANKENPVFPEVKKCL